MIMIQNPSTGWLILDMRSGGMDGYYNADMPISTVESLQDGWAKRLGHNDLLIVQSHGPEFVPIPDNLFLANLLMHAPGSDAHAKNDREGVGS